jgi:hypothetical protein
MVGLGKQRVAAAENGRDRALLLAVQAVDAEPLPRQLAYGFGRETGLSLVDSGF